MHLRPIEFDIKAFVIEREPTIYHISAKRLFFCKQMRHIHPKMLVYYLCIAGLLLYFKEY